MAMACVRVESSSARTLLRWSQIGENGYRGIGVQGYRGIGSLSPLDASQQAFNFAQNGVN
eukprot:15532367-Heterocapsa_arctica.AAC.1